MGRVKAVVCAVCLFAWTTAAAAGEMPHVRGAGGYARWLVEIGLVESPTVAALAQRLASSDVVAYVEVVPLSNGTAKTVLLNAAGPVRYLLISIDADRTPDVLLEMLGHELQHAVEIADAKDVRDEAGLVALYKRIGLHRSATTRFETALAREMGRRTRKDLLDRRPAALYARRTR